MKPLLELLECGQSYWLDNLTRDMIRNGELERRVREQGLRGITSNPKTFSQAVSGSDAYDEQIEELLAGEDLAPVQLYERLITTDIRDACDILRPVHDESEGIDGYVSLEVSPRLAHHAQPTIEEARRLFQAVGRPNLMIKVPGTPAGVPAIEELLMQGINVNITLLFSIPAYEEVARAYLRALEWRAADGKPLGAVSSVASFFLSRIDVLADQLLRHRIPPEGTHGDLAADPESLLGKVAIACAKLAYQEFRSLFCGDRWRRLEEKGARAQRPLWASTGVKDPKYRDVRYVETLIGKDTVVTLPEKTIEAFADHGAVKADSVETGVPEAREVLAELEQVDIPLERVTWQLENEGVQKFIDPFDGLLEILGKKCRQFGAMSAR